MARKIHFFILTAISVLWSLSLYLYNNPFFFTSLAWLKITLFLTVIGVPELIVFIIVLSGRNIKNFKVWLVVLFLLTAAVIFGISTREAILFNSFAITFFLIIFGYAVWGTAILFERFLKSSGTKHLQTVYLLVSLGIFITLLAGVYILAPLITGKTYFFWLAPLFSLIWVIFIGLVVNRRHLFEIGVILKEFLTILLGIFLLILLYLVPTLNLKLLTAFIFLLYFSSGYHIIKSTREEAERRERAEKLAREWEILSQAKDQFVLSLQHHLRTPLTPIKGYLEMILDGVYGREENPVIKEKLEEMKRLANTLYSLLESLLDIQELRLGKKILNLEECQVGEIIEDIIKELKPEAEKKGLHLDFKKTSVPKIKLDKRMVREAIWNLIDNSIKYTVRGGVTVILKIEGDKLEITVSDTGIGMGKNEIERFLRGDLFERGEEAKKIYGPGRGIGLSVSTEFIKAHGGRIWAESKGWNKGTTFCIELPINIS